MKPPWRRKPDTEDRLAGTEDRLARSARVHEDLLSTVARLEMFIAALKTDTEERLHDDDERGATG